MNDQSCKFWIQSYSLQLDLVDYGERLADYEGFWKWFIIIHNEKKECVVKQEGPMGGYYGCFKEAIDELFDVLANIEELNLEEETIEKMRIQLSN